MVGVGDGENNHAFLAHCELGVAVADAIPSLADAADVVTRGGAGAGVVELVEALRGRRHADAHPRRLAIESASASAPTPPLLNPPGDGTFALRRR